jgi:hypothetical protein
MERKWLRPSEWLHSSLFLPLTLAAMTLAMFAGVIFSSGDRTLSQFGTDLAAEFVYWRKFGFDQLRAGHIALWNPYVFSGVPFMGGFQAALFYPPDWIYLVLPLRTAINCEIVLHVFLLGLFTAAWLKRYQLHPLAVLLACTVTMFGGPFFLHVYPGHLATLDAMAWIPLVLLTVNQLLEEPTARWILIGIFAFSMQFLAGHPQTFFNTLIMCLVYGSLRIRQAPHWKRTLVAIAVIGVAAVAITAVQLWTGLDASAEGTRQKGVSVAFAAMFSFPPENFLTLLVPGLFGNMTVLPYWGRCYLWEMSAFIGLTSLTMAIFGTTVRFRGRAICLAMIAAATILALGNHTPLFVVLYRFLPGFDRFRAHSKFLVQATPFLAILTGQGMNHVLRSARGSRLAAMVVLGVVLVVGAAGVCLAYFPGLPPITKGWERLMTVLEATGESYLPANEYADPEFVANAASFAGLQCLVSAGILLGIGLLLYFRSWQEKTAYALALLGIGEIFFFANSSIVSFSLADTVPTTVRDFLSDRPGDYRILQLPDPPSSNGAIAIGARDIWGYDPMVLGRYSEFVTYSQGGNPDDADMYVTFTKVNRMLELLRLRYAFRNQIMAAETSKPLPHLLLVGEWARQPDRDGILSSLNSTDYDFERTAILETDPDPPPTSSEGPPGTAQLVRSDTDSMTIAVHISRPSLLLITDCYSRYWRAIGEPGSAQKHYTVMPADYTLMGVPLSAGDHLIRLEYAPPGYLIGRWVSLAGLALYGIAIIVFLRRRGTRRLQVSGEKPETRDYYAD